LVHVVHVALDAMRQVDHQMAKVAQQRGGDQLVAGVLAQLEHGALQRVLELGHGPRSRT